jgi:hypothetical protein
VGQSVSLPGFLRSGAVARLTACPTVFACGIWGGPR